MPLVGEMDDRNGHEDPNLTEIMRAHRAVTAAGAWAARLRAVPCQGCGVRLERHADTIHRFQPDYAAMAALVETALKEDRAYLLTQWEQELAIIQRERAVSAADTRAAREWLDGMGIVLDP
jgi:hypothetical protein